MNDIPVSIGFFIIKNRAPTWELCEVKIFMINNFLKIDFSFFIKCCFTLQIHFFKKNFTNSYYYAKINCELLRYIFVKIIFRRKKQ